jgi:high-affinity nickel-transport protein
MTITLVSVIVAVVIGGVEALGLIGNKLGLGGGFWTFIDALNENFGALGYLIIGIFLVCWLASVAVYRLMRFDDMEALAERR